MNKQTIQADTSSTGGCKQLIIQSFMNTLEKDWKRIKKVRISDRDHARVFENNKTQQFATVFEDYDKVHVIDKDLYPAPQKSLIESIKAIAKKVKHCGDYGIFYWNEITQTVWCTFGDGDGGDKTEPENPFTDFTDLEADLKSIGVKNVIIEAECDPDISEGYMYLGHFGIVVEW